MTYYEQNLLRKKQIEEGLLELMQTVPYSQISVTTLTQHLQMSRKSFYRYFSGKEACLDSLLCRSIQECALFTSGQSSFSENIREVYLHNLTYWKTRKQLLTAILRNDLAPVFLRHCMEHVGREEKSLQELLSRPELDCDQDVILFYATGLTALLLRWCRDDFNTPVDEMAQKMVRLFHSPLIQVPENG